MMGRTRIEGMYCVKEKIRSNEGKPRGRGRLHKGSKAVNNCNRDGARRGVGTRGERGKLRHREGTVCEESERNITR